MSRSWERAVQRNTKEINKRRKKEGKQSLSAPAAQIDRFKGRSLIMPFTLVLLIVFYILLFKPWSASFEQSAGMFWATVGCYVLLAVFYFLRRPYLAVSKDRLETRRFAGYKTLKPLEVRKIVQMPGYIVIEPVKGGNWVFSKLMNRYPLDAMSVRLKEFAGQHQVEWETRAK
ncbi:hypothetical protein [Cohnella hashimotonis]|uniref:Methyltransferase n=1 Tax=Cohnella hashimotonis TaxID=2826895 RepID=A0ABT6TFN1_9BACL|nr:hypothetical protein [Cohnella hashimotonis]MDI4645626.1 hypothetical protein [Cohnella hashimotonis]